MAKTITGSSVGLMGILVLALVLSLGIAKGTVDCPTLLGLLTPCQPFLLSQTPAPSTDCCVGAQQVASIVELSEENMKSSCKCLKKAGKKQPVPVPIAMQLLSSCDIHINMTIDSHIKCSKLNHDGDSPRE